MTTKEDYESWAIGLVINATEKAKAEGHAEGLAEGVEIGSNDRSVQFALAMLAENEPIEKIVKYSCLPESKILELRDSLKK